MATGNFCKRVTARILFITAVLAATRSGGLAADRAKEWADTMMPQVTAGRRDIHHHPELCNREVRTANLVAAQLKKLKLDVRQQVAYTGVVGILKGGKPGPKIAIRADMDALPVTEEVDVPFASKV